MGKGTIICGILATVIFLIGEIIANGAPQECAAAAIALCVAVIPYCISATIQRNRIIALLEADEQEEYEAG